eukprot:6461712-Pyramimonas_sp.AAC.1
MVTTLNVRTEPIETKTDCRETSFWERLGAPGSAGERRGALGSAGERLGAPVSAWERLEPCENLRASGPKP